MDALFIDDLRRQLRSARRIVTQARELLALTRARRARSPRAARRATLSQEDIRLAILERLADPAFAPILAALMEDAETIATEPQAVARLIVERLKTDPELLTMLFGTPIDVTERLVAEASAPDRAMH